jgi:hypothetical protein
MTADNQLEMTTKRTIMENEQMSIELSYQSRQTEKLMSKNTVRGTGSQLAKHMLQMSGMCVYPCQVAPSWVDATCSGPSLQNIIHWDITAPCIAQAFPGSLHTVHLLFPSGADRGEQ